MVDQIVDVESKPRILVVDDEQNICDMLSRHFRFLGYEVDTCNNGKEALDVMSKKRFDVVISDIMMPVMDGMELLREVQKSYPMVHCIMITGYVTMDNVLLCMRKGAKTCVFKPLEDMTELEDAVKSSIETLKHWQDKLKQLLRMKPEEDML